MGTAQWRTLLADTGTLADLRALAERLDIPYSSVYAKARQMGWRGKDQPAPAPITMSIPEIEAAIAAGNTIAGVAKSMGVLKDRLFRHLRKAGSRAGALPTEQELIVGAIRTYAMRKAGLSKAEIARALGVPFDRVTYILRMFDEHGRRRRPKKTQL
jgi:hypothetical protein